LDALRISHDGTENKYKVRLWGSISQKDDKEMMRGVLTYMLGNYHSGNGMGKVRYPIMAATGKIT